eukprot:165743-Rhodomonas_salina.3
MSFHLREGQRETPGSVIQDTRFFMPSDTGRELNRFSQDVAGALNKWPSQAQYNVNRMQRTVYDTSRDVAERAKTLPAEWDSAMRHRAVDSYHDLSEEVTKFPGQFENMRKSIPVPQFDSFLHSSRDEDPSLFSQTAVYDAAKHAKNAVKYEWDQLQPPGDWGGRASRSRDLANKEPAWRTLTDWNKANETARETLKAAWDSLPQTPNPKTVAGIAAASVAGAAAAHYLIPKTFVFRDTDNTPNAIHFLVESVSLHNDRYTQEIDPETMGRANMYTLYMRVGNMVSIPSYSKKLVYINGSSSRVLLVHLMKSRHLTHYTQDHTLPTDAGLRYQRIVVNFEDTEENYQMWRERLSIENFNQRGGILLDDVSMQQIKEIVRSIRAEPITKI